MHYPSRKTVLAATLTAALACLSPVALHAQTDKAHAAIDQSLKVNGLTGADAQPFHIKANYTIYDPSKGVVVESGTFEEWATAPWTWHRVYTEKKLTGEDWSVAHGKQFKNKDSKLDLAGLDQKVAQTLTNPLALAANYKPGVETTLVAGKVQDEPLNCVSATNPAAAANGINPDLLFPRFCFSLVDSTLRYTTTSSTITSFTEYKPLGSRKVATKVEVKPGNKLGAMLEITLLEALPAGSESQVAPAPKAAPMPWPHQASDPLLVPAKISECAYPMAARNNQELGMVSIPVVILKNGNVKNNGYPMGPPNLAGAANDCVGNWKFQPFMLDGEAVDTSDVLLYNFDGKAFKGTVGIASQAPPPAAK